MSVQLPPIQPIDVVTAEAGPILDHLNKGNFIESSVNPTRWLIEQLRMRTRGVGSLRGHLYVTLYITQRVGSGPLAYHFAPLALMEALGQVDCTAMTPECLRGMRDDTYNLALGRLTAYADDAAARRVLRARRAARLNACGPALEGFMWFYDRLADAIIGPTVIT